MDFSSFTVPWIDQVLFTGDERLPCVQKFFPEVSDISIEAAKLSKNRKNDIIARSREWRNMNMNVNGGLFPGIHFSPDTVLQGNNTFSLVLQAFSEMVCLLMMLMELLLWL